MKFSIAAAVAVMAATVAATPLNDRSAEFTCVKPSYGCGTKLHPKCCEPVVTPPANEKRDGTFVCVPPTYGCGTKLAPKCCHPAHERAVDFACVPPTYGCGTKLHPKCCSPSSTS